MRPIILLALLGLAGCANTVGPFAARSPERVDDPRLAISEQESRERDRYAIPQEGPGIAPPSGNNYRFGQ